jgi:hypothetical protein
LGDQIKRHEIGGGRPRLTWGNVKMDLKETGWERVECIDLAQDRHQWLALINAVINFGFHKMLEISRLAEKLLAFQEEFCPKKLVRNEPEIKSE